MGAIVPDRDCPLSPGKMVYFCHFINSLLTSPVRPNWPDIWPCSFFMIMALDRLRLDPLKRTKEELTRHRKLTLITFDSRQR